MTTRRALGQRTYRQLFGHQRKTPAGPDADFDKQTVDHLFGEIWSEPTLSIRDRSLVTVSVLAALGRDAELRTHVCGLRRQDFSRRQFTHLMIHIAHYAGWPAGHRGLQIVREQLDPPESTARRTVESGAARGRVESCAQTE
jgi:alkylhydroperoxidase/carboxymuconolactone decarboxylase family protein YurZ